ncbi:hypothetical protein ACCS93_38025 [Rhizobium ruizarguesonis]
MADSDAPDAPDATAFHFDNPPTETLTTIVWRALNQSDKLAAFYKLNALQGFRELIQTDPTIRAEFITLRDQTRAARFEKAGIEANDPAGTRNADETIAFHGVDDPDTQDNIRLHAAVRDLNAHPDWVARDAIERNRVIQPYWVGRIRLYAAERDVDAGMAAPNALERNGVDDEFAADGISQQAALRDVDAGMNVQTAIDRNRVIRPFTVSSIWRHAAERARQRQGARWPL